MDDKGLLWKIVGTLAGLLSGMAARSDSSVDRAPDRVRVVGPGSGVDVERLE